MAQRRAPWGIDGLMDDTTGGFDVGGGAAPTAYDAPPLQAPAPAPSFAPQTPDTSGWNTDGFGNPAYTTASAGNVMSGWDADKWTDPNHQTPKYVGGRIFSSYDPNDPANWAKAAAEFQQAYPGSTYNGKDKITMPDGRVIDFVTNASGEGSKGWAWQDESMPQESPMQAPTQPQVSLRQPGSGGTGASGSAAPGALAAATEGSSASPQARESIEEIYARLMGSGIGDLNEEMIGLRTESAREGMEKTRRSQVKTDQAALANRGLMGSGAEISAITGLSEDLGETYAGATRDIYADEMENADQRFSQALGLEATLTGEDQRNLLDRYGIDVNRDVAMRGQDVTRAGNDQQSALGWGRLGLDDKLGTGGLALQNQQLNNQWNQFAAQFGLDSQVAMHGMSDADMGRLIEILRLRGDATDTSAGGYV